MSSSSHADRARQLSSPDHDLSIGWHTQWVLDLAEDRAVIAFVQMHGAVQPSFCDTYLLPWERLGLALAADVRDAMTGIEEAAFIERAEFIAVEIFVRRLHHLLLISPKGGAA